MEDGGEAGAQLDGLELRDVGREGLVDLGGVRLDQSAGVAGVVRDDARHLGLAELEYPLVQVAEILEQVVVVGVDELLPLELGVAGLGSSRQEIVPPDVRVDAGVLGGVAKDANALGFTELAAFVVQIFGGR